MSWVWENTLLAALIAALFTVGALALNRLTEASLGAMIVGCLLMMRAEVNREQS